MAELTLEQSLQQILPTLPLPIQKFFEQRKLGEIARLLTERYALHIDQGAILERELMLLLLGLENPDEFAETLYAELPISKQTARDIIADVNQEIFVPLRDEMRSTGGGSAYGGKGGNTSQTAKPAAVSAQPRREVVMPLNTVIIPSNPQMPVRPPETFAPTLKYAPPAKNIEFRAKTPLAPPTPPQPHLPASSLQPPASRLLEDHEEPHIEFHKPVVSDKMQVASSPTADTPLRQALRAIVPPANLPGAMPPRPTPEVRPSPAIPKVEPQAQPRVVPPPAKPYSSDPYREPIDEK